MVRSRVLSNSGANGLKHPKQRRVQAPRKEIILRIEKTVLYFEENGYEREQNKKAMHKALCIALLIVFGLFAYLSLKITGIATQTFTGLSLWRAGFHFIFLMAEKPLVRIRPITVLTKRKPIDTGPTVGFRRIGGDPYFLHLHHWILRNSLLLGLYSLFGNHHPRCVL